jgi:hypothetical protein
MTEAIYATIWQAKTPPFGMQDLLRLVIWGTCAAAALALAVVSINSSFAVRRTAAPPATAETAAQSMVVASETRRLTEAVQVLAAEREQILSRLSALERGLSDVTGSIKSEARPASPAATTREEPPAPVASTVTPGQGPSAGEAGGQTEANSAVPAHAGEAAEAAAGLGVDVGGATNFEGLRTLWSSTKHNLPPLPDELYPVVGVRENSKGSADLRLIIGPITGPEVALRLCSKLAAAHHYCQPAAFLGQRLSLVEPAPKAHPATTPTIIELAPLRRPAPGPRQP